MVFSNDLQNELRKYLLMQISEDQREKIEQRLLTNDDYFEELEIVEDELIDEFLEGGMAEAERKLFEQSVLVSPEWQGKLRFARALAARSVPVPEPIPSTWWERLKTSWGIQSWMLRAATAGALLVVIAGIIWFALPPSPRTFATFTLPISTSERSQGGVATKIKLPLPAEVLRLQLTLPEGMAQATRYRVELLRENGEKENLPPVEQTQQTVAVEMPADRISRGQYALNLFATKSDGTEERVKGSYLITAE